MNHRLDFCLYFSPKCLRKYMFNNNLIYTHEYLDIYIDLNENLNEKYINPGFDKLSVGSW